MVTTTKSDQLSKSKSIWQRFKDKFGGGEDSNFIIFMLVPAGFVFIVGILFPLIYGLFITFFHLDVSKPGFQELSFNNFIAFNNYLALLQEQPPFRNFLRYYANTLIFTVVTVLFELILGLIIALLLDKAFKGRGIVRAAVLVPWAIPTIVNAKIWQLMFLGDESGVINDIFIRLGMYDKPLIFEGLGISMPLNIIWSVCLFAFPICIGILLFSWLPNFFKRDFDFLKEKGQILLAIVTIVSGIIFFLPQEALPGGLLSFANFSFPSDFFVVFIVDIWKTVPFMALLILADLQTIPRDLYKASEVDGATAWQKFREVTLPLILPGIGTALIFRCIDAFRVYDILAVFSNDSIASLTKLAVNKHSDGLYSAASTIAIFTFLNILVFVIFMTYLTRRRGER